MDIIKALSSLGGQKPEKDSEIKTEEKPKSPAKKEGTETQSVNFMESVLFRHEAVSNRVRSQKSK